MIEFPVGFGCYRVWRNEHLPASPAGEIVQSHETFTSARFAASTGTAAVEVVVPVGGRILYGLLGASYQPSDGQVVSSEMHSTDGSLEELPLFQDSPGGLGEGARVGLIRDDVSDVLESLDQRLQTFPAGVLRFTIGASASGSSSELYRRIATVVIDLLQDPSMPTHLLEPLITSRIRREKSQK